MSIWKEKKSMAWGNLAHGIHAQKLYIKRREIYCLEYCANINICSIKIDFKIYRISN